jgi:hypothetical protein
MGQPGGQEWRGRLGLEGLVPACPTAQSQPHTCPGQKFWPSHQPEVMGRMCLTPSDL